MTADRRTLAERVARWAGWRQYGNERWWTTNDLRRVMPEDALTDPALAWRAEIELCETGQYAGLTKVRGRWCAEMFNIPRKHPKHTEHWGDTPEEAVHRALQARLAGEVG